MHHRLLLLIASLPLWMCACGDSEAEDPPPAQPSASAQPAAPAVPPQAAAPQSQGLPAPVDAKRLEALLVERQGEWPRIELQSTPVETGDGTIVQVTGVYQQKSTEPMVYVMLTDTRGIKSLHGTYVSMRDQPSKGMRSFDQAGHLAIETFSSRPLYTSVTVLVRERFLVVVSGEGVDQATVQRFVDGLDWKALAALE